MPAGGTRFLALFGVVVATLVAWPASASAGSAHIAALQVAMNALGLYPHPVDGISGPWTQGAVRTFQAQHGLAVDGIPGPQTRAVLGWRGKPLLGARPMRNGKRGWDVAALQFLLNNRGFGPGDFDGGFGPNTESAVRRYQAAAGLAADGIAGPSTLAALRSRRVITAPGDPVRFVRPVPGPIGDGFGWIPPGRWHTGLDFPAAKGTPIGAGGRGSVVFAGLNTGGYGNLVVIRHRLGFESWYGHMSSIAASVGQYVAGGSTIGYVGSTGRSTGPHLHFEVRQFGSPVDPGPRLIGYVPLARRAGKASASASAAGGESARAAGKKRKRRCRPNADARQGRDTDPLTARLDRCP
ncbi:MAG TPA: peptidoglycan-binding protein [Solirubrobacterales bacterium]|nr:peptidoglycan-binding protein [Solirubrobacterales bacterium]